LTRERAPGFAGVPADVFENMVRGKIGAASTSEVMMMKRAQEIAERELHQKFEAQDPGLLARVGGFTALGLPRLAAGAVGMFDTGMGRRMAESMARDQAGVTGWIARQQGLGTDTGHFMNQLALAQGLRESRAWDENTIVGGEFGADTTVSQFRGRSRALGRSPADTEKILGSLLAKVNQLTVKPILVPGPQKQLAR
jgi:hypothetical protein